MKACSVSHRFSPPQSVFQVLTGIFGVGAKTADRWIRDGIHSLQQLQDSGQTLNRAQQAGVCCWHFVSALLLYFVNLLFEWIVDCPSGLQHYEDVNRPVTKAEADAIGEIVEKAVFSVLPGAQMSLIGGFRR